MVHSSQPDSGLVAGRDIAPDEFVDLGFDDRAFQNDAAVRPFNPAVAGRDIRLGQDDQTAGKAALLGQRLDTGVSRLVRESLILTTICGVETSWAKQSATSEVTSLSG